ncbi:caspase family protein [Candidatus Berkiella cookevillensis]|uniref:Caspase domain protein n=1 Tax=Candidatus Berkiella cookevillensis TaxID=437022 RepID=A0A0Q9Y918_9GAMM|nr:caspase family protein [Candidatus Berkiella cookevillensis]MCS5707364.1 caspase family protein [Candidatus Berkiella cookevillensis]
MANKALLIGINYLGTSARLNGCANDIKAIQSLLQKNGYEADNIKMLSDDIAGAIAPTRRNILNELKALIKNAKAGDTLFFHYSGHGTYTRDLSLDEKDGRDEAICPISGGDIIDDELNAIVRTLPKNVKMLCLFDSCHSGTVLDLENNLIEKGTRRPRFSEHGYAVMMSGCRDAETSADAYIDKRYQGAMTAAFLNMVEEYKGLKNILDILLSNSKKRMTGFLEKMHIWLENNEFPQRPNIAFEGSLPSITPMLTGLRVGRYNLRVTPSRNKESHDTVVTEPENHISTLPRNKPLARELRMLLR